MPVGAFVIATSIVGCGEHTQVRGARGRGARLGRGLRIESGRDGAGACVGVERILLEVNASQASRGHPVDGLCE